MIFIAIGRGSRHVEWCGQGGETGLVGRLGLEVFLLCTDNHLLFICKGLGNFSQCRNRNQICIAQGWYKAKLAREYAVDWPDGP